MHRAPLLSLVSIGNRASAIVRELTVDLHRWLDTIKSVEKIDEERWPSSFLSFSSLRRSWLNRIILDNTGGKGRSTTRRARSERTHSRRVWEFRMPRCRGGNCVAWCIVHRESFNPSPSRSILSFAPGLSPRLHSPALVISEISGACGWRNYVTDA